MVEWFIAVWLASRRNFLNRQAKRLRRAKAGKKTMNSLSYQPIYPKSKSSYHAPGL